LVLRRLDELEDLYDEWLVTPLGIPLGFDIDEAERLLRVNDTENGFMPCDTLGALIINKSHLEPKEGGEQLFKQLISRVGDILFAEDKNGCNAAHSACLYYPQDTVALLFLSEMVQRKPEIIGQTAGEAHRNRTYLHLAAKQKWSRVVEWLLKKNASIEQKDMDGEIAWDVAFGNNDGVVMSMLAVPHVARQIEEAKNNEIGSQETRSIGTRRNEAKRYWFRMNSEVSDDDCEYLMKRFDLPDESSHAMFKLFIISKNSVGLLLLASQIHER
jgi:hypothetical protein